MKYVELPLPKIEVGKPVPVNVWDAKGNLLLRKGQPIISDTHREHMAAHNACAVEAEFRAWQRAYDRLIYAMVRDGMSLDQISKTSMPSEILEIDFAVGHEVVGNWLDLHDLHSALLHQGGNAKQPLARVDSIQKAAMNLLHKDADASLFTLFQAMPDRGVAYSAKHALLCAVLCELIANKLNVQDEVRPVLFRAALLMNMAMANEQDTLARQTVPPSPDQRMLILDHPERSVALMRGFGLVNEDLFDIVAGHHTPHYAQGLARNLECRQILCMADQFVAKMADRATRKSLTGPTAARAVMASSPTDVSRLASALVTAVGFYPPGTYVALANGDTAVVVRRGAAANTPSVLSVVGHDGVALAQYANRDTRDTAFAITAPVHADQVKLKLNADKVLRAVAKPH